MNKKNIKKRFTALVMTLAVLVPMIPVETTYAASEDYVYVDIPVTYDQTSARSMLDIVNEFRTSDTYYINEDCETYTYVSGLSGFVYDYELEKVAMKRAAEIAIYYGHTRPNGKKFSTANTTSWTYCAENICSGYGVSATAAFNLWKEDYADTYSGQGHRRSMLDSGLTRIGIAHVSYNGYEYWVQEFSNSTSESGLVETEAYNGDTIATLEYLASNIGDYGLTASSSSIKLTTGQSTSLPSVQASLRNSVDEVFQPIVLEGFSGWSSSDTSIASIEGDYLYAGSTGTTTITGSAYGVTISVPVTVTDGSTSSGSDSSSSGGGSSSDNGDDDEDDTSVTTETETEAEEEKEESITLDSPSISSISNTKSGIKIKWNSVDGADGYRIYRISASPSTWSSSSTWTKMKTIKSGSTTTWTDKHVGNNNKYTYTIQAYNSNGESEYGSQKKSFYYVPATSITQITSNKAGKLAVRWAANCNSSDWQLSYSTSKSFKKSKTVNAPSTGKTITGLSKGKTYYVRVRTVYKVNGKKYYSAWSSTEKVKIKK